MKSHSLTPQSIESLVCAAAGDYASIYLALGRPSEAVVQGPISLKNAASAIEERLFHRGRRTSEAREFVDPLYGLVEDPVFWRTQGPGLALFVSNQGLQAFRLQHAPESNWWVGTRFRILPLLARTEMDVRYYLLAVSAKEAVLYHGSNDGLVPLPIADMPLGLAAALDLNHPEPYVQVLNTPVGATVHGQGGEVDRRKTELRDYFQRITRAIHPYLADSQKPLLFAGVEYLFPLFREVNAYSHLLESRLCGNPERMGVPELEKRASELLMPYRRRSFEIDAARFEDAVGIGRTADKLQTILDVAHRGMVEALFAVENEIIWGRFNPGTKTLDVTYADDPIADDLYDLAAFKTLLHGGRVHVVPAQDISYDAAASALLRYAGPHDASGRV